MAAIAGHAAAEHQVMRAVGLHGIERFAHQGLDGRALESGAEVLEDRLGDRAAVLVLEPLGLAPDGRLKAG